MKIGVDARVLERSMSGVGRFLLGIIQEIPVFDNKNEYILFSRNKILNDNLPFKNIATLGRSLPFKLDSFFWLSYILPKYLYKNNITIFFSPNHLVSKNINQKSIIVVHDVFHKISSSFHPFLYRKYLDYMLPLSLVKSDIIITVSENSKKDILRYYKEIDESKIRVLYQYANPYFKRINLTDQEKREILLRNKLKKNVILFVGVIENRKNIIAYLKIADKMNLQNLEIDFVIIGKPGYGFKKINTEMRKREKYVKYFSSVSDEFLLQMYNISKILLYPTFYEGFGLPALEAMQCGLPVIASNTSSLNEVVGEGGILHHPNDIDSFCASIKELLDNKEKMEYMKNAALIQAAKFNHKRTVEDFLKIIKELED